MKEQRNSARWIGGRRGAGARARTAAAGLPALAVVVLTVAVGACGGVDDPAVPEVRSADPAGDDVVTFPVRADGTVDASQLAEIIFDEDTYDFGRVDAGAVVRHRFPFRNTGQRPLVIRDARSTCGCTVPQYPREPVAAGDTASILVSFDTEGKAGPQDKPVTLTANTYPNRSTVTLVGRVD